MSEKHVPHINNTISELYMFELLMCPFESKHSIQQTKKKIELIGGQTTLHTELSTMN